MSGVSGERVELTVGHVPFSTTGGSVGPKVGVSV